MSGIAYALLGALVGGILTYFTTLRTLYDKSIISERRKWRNEVRKITIKIIKIANNNVSKDTSIAELRHSLAIRLNPGDVKDRDILNCPLLKEEKLCKCAVDEFVMKVAILLKHDWERAKLESSPLKKLFVVIAHVPRQFPLI